MRERLIKRGADRYIDQIQALGDKNSSTLGFIPSDAFRQFAKDERIFCALDGQKVIAYVLFRIRKKTNCIVLVHVCVANEYRKSGIASRLINEVVEQYPFHRFIEVSCRRDYALDELWKRNGFYVVREKPGRSTHGSILTVWRRNIQERDLLFLAHEKESEDKLIAVLDTNIIIELCDTPDNGAVCLLDDSLSDYVIYQVTPECRAEINQNPNAASRNRHLGFANRYSLLQSNSEFEELLGRLKLRFDPNDNHKADIRHLAYCVSARVDIFITRDNWICGLHQVFIDEFGLNIMRPEEMYAKFEELAEAHEYAPESLVGSSYTEALLSNSDLAKAINLYSETKKKKSVFSEWIRACLIDNRIKVYVIKQNNSVVGLYAYQQYDRYTELLAFILIKSIRMSIRNTLARCMLERVIYHVAEDTNNCTALIINSDCVDVFSDVIVDCGFTAFKHGFIRFILKGVLTPSQAVHIINNYVKELSCEKLFGKTDRDNQIIEGLRGLANQQPLALEKVLGPVAIIYAGVPTWIIPIKPKYAVRLFDHALANINTSFLENQHEFAALSTVNSYYSRSKMRLKAPCRVLWYVSQDEKYYGSGGIRACSIIYDIEKGTKKELYRKHQKYGVLDWTEMKAIDEEQIIQVFSFENTKPFANPIKYRKIDQIVLEEDKKRVQLIGPCQASEAVAERILLEGLEGV